VKNEIYCSAKFVIEPKKAAEWDAHDVVTAHIYVCDECLPSATNGNPYSNDFHVTIMHSTSNL
jgi:hypothetical protein